MNVKFKIIRETVGTFKINLFKLATHVFRDRGLLVTPSICRSNINESEAFRSQQVTKYQYFFLNGDTRDDTH